MLYRARRPLYTDKNYFDVIVYLVIYLFIVKSYSIGTHEMVANVHILILNRKNYTQL